MNVKISIVLKSFEKLKKVSLGGQRVERREAEVRQQARRDEGASKKFVAPSPERASTSCVPAKAATCVAKRAKHVRSTRSGTMKLPVIWHSIGLPLHQSLYTVIRSPHIDKKSREQFTLKVHKQLIIINTELERIRDVLASLKFHNLSGVQMKIIFEYRTHLNSLIK